MTPSTHYFEYYDIDTILSGELGTALRCGVWKPFIFSVTKFLEEASDGMEIFRKFSLLFYLPTFLYVFKTGR